MVSRASLRGMWGPFNFAFPSKEPSTASVHFNNTAVRRKACSARGEGMKPAELRPELQLQGSSLPLSSSRLLLQRAKVHIYLRQNLPLSQAEVRKSVTYSSVILSLLNWSRDRALSEKSVPPSPPLPLPLESSFWALDSLSFVS